MTTATKKPKRKPAKWAKVTVYAVSIETFGRRQVVHVTPDAEDAAERCRQFNRSAPHAGYAWHVGLELNVPPRSECEAPWHKAG